MFYVYILHSKKLNRYYVGFSKNLKDRLRDHNSQNVTTTATSNDYKLIWYSAFLSKKKALDFERYLKSGSGFAFRNKRLV